MSTNQSFYEEQAIAPDNIEGSVPGIATMPNGDILAVYLALDRIVGVVSSDRGATWDEPSVIVSGANIGDPSLLVTQDATILHYSEVEAIFESPDKPPQYRRAAWMQRVSWDNGTTWSEAIQVDTGKRYGGSPHEGIVTRDGTLLWPYWWEMNCENEGQPLEAQMIGVATVMKSRDNGKTWFKGGDVQLDLPNGADEPSVVELSNGNLLMLIRTTVGRHYQTVSTDVGETWSDPCPSVLVASNTPAAVYRLPGEGNGIAVVWDHTAYIGAPNRFPLDVAVSYDDCATWSHSRVLTNPGCQVSYPGITVARDGLILVIGQQWLKKTFIYPPYTNIKSRLKCARFTEAWLREGSPL